MLRNDKVSGVITLVVGIVIAAFAASGLIATALQRLMLAVTPEMSRSPDGDSFVEGMRALHHVWLIYFPFLIAGGLLFCASGFYVMRGSLAARRVAQATAMGGYLWLIAYFISCSQIMDLIGPKWIGEPGRSVMQWFFMVLSAVFGATIPTAVLFVLSRPRNRHAMVPAADVELV